MKRVEAYDLEENGVVIAKAYFFVCPGCGQGHQYRVRKDGKRPSWAFTGTVDSPTFHPSMLVRWADPGGKEQICHFFVKAGRIEFCGDSTHPHAGKTLELKDF